MKPVPKSKKITHPIKRREQRQRLLPQTNQILDKSGRRTSYNPQIHTPIAFYHAFLGATEETIAKIIGICPATLYSWKKKFPEFKQACEVKSTYILGDVVSSLIKKAIGYVVEDREISYKQHLNKATGEVIQTQDVKVFTKHVAPDLGAIITLLANRDPLNWRRTDSPLQDLKDRDKPGAVAAELPDEYLEDVVRKASPDVKPCYSNWDAMGTEDEFIGKLKRMVSHNPEKPS